MYIIPDTVSVTTDLLSTLVIIAPATLPNATPNVIHALVSGIIA